MTYRKKLTLAFTVVMLAALAAAIACVPSIDHLRETAVGDEALYIPSATAIKHLSLGYTGLMADIYWTRAVQYFGERHHIKAKTYPLLYPLLDITTQLDPHLTIAYEFGSIFLSQAPPEGAGLPEQGVVLVERGIRENPSRWRLYYHLGYIQALELHDYKAASETFLKGSEIPGAYPWMKVLAAQLAQQGGAEETSRFLWARIYESADDAMIRKNAADHLRALQVDQDVKRLEDAVRAYRQQTGKPPASFSDLVALGWLRRIPTDPAGHAYRLASDGHVYVQDPAEFPFLTRGLPPNTKGAITPELPF
jgi:hypothetical protein